MARILLLTQFSGGGPVVVNTRNITTMLPSRQHDARSVWTSDGDYVDVSNPIEDILHSWAHGVDAGEVKVFDDGTV